MRFTNTKSETLKLRVSPIFKLILKEAADAEQRSMVNMLKLLLEDYCERKGVTSPGPKTAPLVHQRVRVVRRATAGAAA